MSPWVESSPSLGASRWLDESGVALKAPAVQGVASVAGSLVTLIQPQGGGGSSGHSSVSGTLSLVQLIQGASAGQALVTGVMGYVYDIAGQSLGSAQVAGELIVGQAEFIAGAALGVSAVSGDLSVERFSKISGNQAGDNWGSGADLPPMGSGRDEGPTRRRFSKNSSGRVVGALA